MLLWSLIKTFNKTHIAMEDKVDKIIKYVFIGIVISSLFTISLRLAEIKYAINKTNEILNIQ